MLEYLPAASAGFFGIGQERRNLNYQKNLMDIQNMYAKENMALQHQYGKKMYDYTNFPEQMKRMKKEGLNIGLMYKQGASGGQVTQPSPSGPSGGPNSQQAEMFSLTAKLAQEASMQQAQKKLLEEQTQAQNIQNRIAISGIKDKEERERLKAELDRKKATSDIYVQQGEDESGKIWDDNTKMTRYEVGELEKLKAMKLDNLVKKAQEGLSKATASNLVSNDELIRLQTALLSAEMGIIESETFQKLPKELQAVLLALMKKFGG